MPRRRPCSQPPSSSNAVYRDVPRQLRQPANAFCETSALSLHPQINRFPAPATTSRRLAHPLTHTRAISRTGPRNPTVSAAAHDSLPLPRKTMPGDAAGHTTPHACHAKHTLSNVKMHESPRLPRETSIHRHAATRSRHAELQRPIATPKRTRRGRSRTLGAHAAKTSQTRTRPQTPTSKQEPFATHSGTT